MNKLFLLLVTLLLTSPVFARFCPNNFNQIDLGATMDQVRQQCGKPIAEKKLPAENNGPQEWIYYVAFGATAMTTFNADANATVKMNIAFNAGKVINITVNDMSLAATTVCGPNIQVGNTPDQIKSACGKPTIINKNNNNQPPPPPLIEFQYGGTSPASFIFESGKLKEIQ